MNETAYTIEKLLEIKKTLEEAGTMSGDDMALLIESWIAYLEY